MTTRLPDSASALRELPDGRGLAGTVDADHEDGRFGDGERVFAGHRDLGGDLFGKTMRSPPMRREAPHGRPDRAAAQPSRLVAAMPMSA